MGEGDASPGDGAGGPCHKKEELRAANSPAHSMIGERFGMSVVRGSRRGEN